MGAQAGKSVEMENFFSRLTLDIIGKAVFNYDFDSLTHDDPVIQVCLLTASLSAWIDIASQPGDVSAWSYCLLRSDRTPSKLLLYLGCIAAIMQTQPSSSTSTMQKYTAHVPRRCELTAALLSHSVLTTQRMDAVWLQAVHTVLGEAEYRSTHPLPYQNLPMANIRDSFKSLHDVCFGCRRCTQY